MSPSFNAHWTGSSLFKRYVLGAALLLGLTAVTGAVAQAGIEVRVYPGRASLVPGGEMRFVAEATDESNAQVLLAPDWQILPEHLGTVTPDGVFLAGPIPGRGILRAVVRDGEIEGVGHAVVEIAEIASQDLIVRVLPQTAWLSPGDPQKFTAEVTDPASGEKVPCSLVWRVLPGDLGTITQEGLFGAGETEGAGRIVASASCDQGRGIGHSYVAIGSMVPEAATIEIQPTHLVLTTGQSAEFRVVVQDKSGTSLRVTVRWDVLPPTLGVIDGNGHFTASMWAGEGRVVASVGGESGLLRAVSRVVVADDNIEGLYLAVHPREAVVRPGGRVRFRPEFVGGNPDRPPPEVRWTLEPSSLGHMESDGTLVVTENPQAYSLEGMRGLVTAFAMVGEKELRASARVMVRPEQIIAKVIPQDVTTLPGDQVRFELELASDAKTGVEPVGVEWSVQPADLGTIDPNGLFTAARSLGGIDSGTRKRGEGVVVARARLGSGQVVTARARIRLFLEHQEIHVFVSPTHTDLQPGQTQQFEVRLEGQGSGAFKEKVTWQVQPNDLGLISTTGLFTAGQANRSKEGKIIAQVRLAGNRVSRGFATVRIRPRHGEIGDVSISPLSARLGAGEHLSFEVAVFDDEGHPLSDAQLEWQVNPPELGTVTPQGAFLAAGDVQGSVRGYVTVVARSGASVRRASASVEVVERGSGEGLN